MNSEKTDGVVLRIVEFSETSCVVTWFTRDFGKITTLAKGARRRKNPFEGAIDSLAQSRLVFLRKSSDSLDLLTEAKLEKRFRAGEKSLSRLYCGFHILELLNLLTEPYDPQPKLYAELEQTLAHLETEVVLSPWVTRFELQVLLALGQIPQWQQCVNCGVEIPQRPRCAFSPVEGGVVCDACRVGQRHILSVSQGTRDYLRSLGQNPETQPALANPERGWGEVRGVMGQLLQHVAGRPLRVLPHLNFLARPKPDSETRVARPAVPVTRQADQPVRQSDPASRSPSDHDAPES